MPVNLDAVRQAHIDLLNRYALALDGRDWSAHGSLFTTDAVFTARLPQSVAAGDAGFLSLTGRGNIVESISRVIEGTSATQHVISNHVVNVGPDASAADMSCYFRAYHAGKGERAHLFQEALGRFELKTVRVGSEWKIRRMDETVVIMLGTMEAFGVLPHAE